MKKHEKNVKRKRSYALQAHLLFTLKRALSEEVIAYASKTSLEHQIEDFMDNYRLRIRLLCKTNSAFIFQDKTFPPFNL